VFTLNISRIVPVECRCWRLDSSSGAQRRAEDEMTDKPDLQMPHLDLDTAIRLRWALRDIKGKRTKLTPVSPGDLRTLIEMGLIEMRDEVPVLTNEGERAVNWN
jgi:hypothetical protein